MAVSEQCMRESQALHPDYYRTKQKTRLRLNNGFISRVAHVMHNTTRAQTRAFFESSVSIEGQALQKNARMKKPA